jgi:hypothetical protein
MTDSTYLTSQHGDGTDLAAQTPEHNEDAERSKLEIGNAGELPGSEATADSPGGMQATLDQPNLAGETDTFQFGMRMLPDLADAHVIEQVDAQLLSNYVEVVGYVCAQRMRGRDVILHGHRDAERNTGWYDIVLHVDESERATAFGIKLQIRARARALIEMLEALRDGDRLWACGQLLSQATYDTRFAEQAGPSGPTLGRPMQELSVRVMRLRRARPENANGSLVKLRGTLIQTPRMTTHEMEMALELARCILNVESVLPSTNPRTRAYVHVQSRIPVDLPLLIPGAVQVLRRGNVIDVDGWFEPYRQRIRLDREPEWSAVLERMQHTFAIRKQAMSEAELRRAEPAFRRQMLDLQTEPRIRIRGGYAVLIAGTPIQDVAEARANYVAWDRERRRINRERAARQATRQRRFKGTVQTPATRVAHGAPRPQPRRTDEGVPAEFVTHPEQVEVDHAAPPSEEAARGRILLESQDSMAWSRWHDDRAVTVGARRGASPRRT